MTAILLVGAGGFVGANVRFAIAVWSRRRYEPGFPVGTLIVNVAGSFLMGLVMGLLADTVTQDRELRWLLAIGFLGAETTFSAFAVETLDLDERGERSHALINVVANTAVSLAAVAVGLIAAWLMTDVV